MKRHARSLACAVLAAALVAAGCGGKQSMASKSAAAYDEARKKRLPVGGGHEHGGHEATATNAGHAEHGTMTNMDHSTMTGMDHSTMTGVDHSRMAGMDHSQTKHGNAGVMDHSRMQHGGTGTMDHSQMQHGTGAIPSGGLWGPVGGAATTAGAHAGHTTPAPLQQRTVPLGTAPAPTSSREMQQLQPAMTLRQDAVDLASPISVREAGKASGGTAGPSASSHVKKEKQ